MSGKCDTCEFTPDSPECYSCYDCHPDFDSDWFRTPKEIEKAIQQDLDSSENCALPSVSFASKLK